MIPAGSDELWEVVSDPSHLPRWWPDVVRVEEATPLAWTQVLGTDRGKTVRADFTRLEAHEPRRIAWQQEIEESPFERILSQNVTEIELEPSGERATRVELRATQKLRGSSRFGSLMLRRATRRKLDEALDGLERMLGTS
jgi:uncharacterized protein YndB with AHSA1/START domain